ncbi:MAG TPA: helix-turn-helix domain-containing protein [Acidimicrobiales bacterium]|jgi:AcrR family transcriptional regulator|nr:helix-turn-helix domain-containing protein [Acidimicrobiales bacterium]
MAMTDSPRANSRAALIEAAFEEFSAKGYEAATVAGIAERAGVTTGALYAHFNGKLDLLLATTGLMPVEVVMRTMADLASLPWTEAPRTISLNMIEPAQRLTLLLDVIVSARRDPHIAGILRTGLEAYLQAAAEALETGQALGLVDPVLAPEALSRFFTLLNMGTIAFAALGEEPPDVESLARAAELLIQPVDRGADDDDIGSESPPLARVRVKAQALERARQALEESIVGALDDGHSLRTVGRVAGLSHERIRQVVRDRAPTDEQTGVS